MAKHAKDPKKVSSSRDTRTTKALKWTTDFNFLSCSALQKSMDDNTALDLLSGDFSAAPKPESPAASSKATTKLECPVPGSDPLKVAGKISK